MSKTPEFDPGSSLAVIAASNPHDETSSANVERTGQFITHDGYGLQPVALDEIGRTSDMLTPTGIPGYIDLTHPQYFDETHLMTFSAVVLAAQGMNPAEAARTATSGRVLDIDIQETIPETGGSRTPVKRLAILDDAHMPGELGMRDTVNQADKRGEYTPYKELVDRPDDVFMVWQLQRDVERYDGQQGEWVLRSVIAPDAHPTDMFAMWAFPIKDPHRTAAFDTFEYQGTFLDHVSFDDSKISKSPLNNLKGKQIGKVKPLASAVAKSVLDPEYNPEDDNGLNEREGLLSRVSSKIGLRDIYEEVQASISAHLGSPIAQPAHMFARTSELIGRLDKIEAEQGKSDGLTAAKKRLLQSLIAGAVFMQEIGTKIGFMDSRVKEARMQEEIADHSIPSQPGARFVIQGLDDIDADIARKAGKAKKIYATDKRDGKAAIAERLQHLLFPNRGRENTLAVRALGRNQLLELDDLHPYHANGNPSQAFMYDGVGMPHGAYGHYWDEVVRSLVEPEIDSKRFPEGQLGRNVVLGGLAMSGVVKVFDLVAPEMEQDPQEPPRERFMITSAKEQPNIVTQTVLGQYFSDDRTERGLHELTNGSQRLTHILTQEHEQKWQVAQVRGKHLELTYKTLAEGAAFALSYDGAGDIYPDFGHIKGKKVKPLKREMAQARSPRKVSSRPTVEYDNEVTGRLPLANGSTVDNVLFEVVCRDGAIYVKDTPDPRVISRAIQHFRLRNPDYGRRGRSK